MKTFYSIIYTQLSPVSKERLNLGLLMISEQEVKFQFAPEKLNVIKKLLSNDAQKLILSYLKGIQNRLELKNELIEPNREITESYISYLSDYSNNLVSFTKAEYLKTELNDSVYQKLFDKLIYKTEVKGYILDQTRQDADIFKYNFFKRVNKRVNTAVELTTEKLDFILFPIKIDMIGKNEAPVLSQFIDFDSTSNALQNNLSSYISLIKPFELKEHKEGKFFIIGDEPLRDNKKQHLIWEHLSTSPLIKEEIIEVIPQAEVEVIEEYLNEHDVHPYFKEGA